MSFHLHAFVDKDCEVEDKDDKPVIISSSSSDRPQKYSTLNDETRYVRLVECPAKVYSIPPTRRQGEICDDGWTKFTAFSRLSLSIHSL